MSRRAFNNEFVQSKGHELPLQADSINVHVGPGSSLASCHQDLTLQGPPSLSVLFIFLQMMWDDVFLCLFVFVLLTQGLQLALEKSATECELVWVRVSTTKSVLSQKRVEFQLQVGNELFPRVEEFKPLRVLFMSVGRMEQETDRLISVSCAVMWKLQPSVVTKRELSMKMRLSIYGSILTYGHKM